MNAEERVEFAYNSIKTAAGLLHTAEVVLESTYAEMALSLRRQEDVAWFLDPTTMMQPGVKEDLERKIRLLNITAKFLKGWNEVRTQALDAAEKADE